MATWLVLLLKGDAMNFDQWLFGLLITPYKMFQIYISLPAKGAYLKMRKRHSQRKLAKFRAKCTREFGEAWEEKEKAKSKTA
jgi:hypothetical protein